MDKKNLDQVLDNQNDLINKLKEENTIDYKVKR